MMGRKIGEIIFRFDILHYNMSQGLLFTSNPFFLVFHPYPKNLEGKTYNRKMIEKLFSYNKIFKKLIKTVTAKSLSINSFITSLIT